jgi:RNA polymerase sigma-54 factor
VRARIRGLIDREEPLKPLSDDKLVELLRRDGHDIARRTVTKYREAMGIPSSFDRRRRALVKAA